MQKWVSVFWPSFVVSALATAVVFLWLDPTTLRLVGRFDWDELGYYSITFFFLWFITALTTLISHFFNRPPESFNRNI